MRMILPLALVAVLAGFGRHAQQLEGELRGHWMLSATTLIDPGPQEPIDRVLLSLTSDGAKAIFDAMPGRATDIDCSGARVAGLRRKVAGGLECSVQQAEYHCDVGIVLRDGKTVPGYACD